MSPPTSTPSSKPAERGSRRLGRAFAWFVAGGLGCAIVAAAAALTVIEAGLFDARAITPHRAVVGWAAHTAMIHAFQRYSADIEAPSRYTVPQIQAGFSIYDTHCVMCHGGPGVSRAAWTTGLTPTPPFLVDAARQWSPAELRVIVGDGVKMTAMPAWSTTLDDRQLWEVVAFLEAMPGLSATDYARMRATRIASDPRARLPVRDRP